VLHSRLQMMIPSRRTKREACQPRSLAIQLLDGRDVPACAYIYEDKNILDPTTPLAEMASMVVTAKGKSGACVDYISCPPTYLSRKAQHCHALR